MEAMGGLGQRVEPTRGDPRCSGMGHTRPLLLRRLPVLVEVMVEPEANAAMGPALNAISEYEPLPYPTTSASMNEGGSQEPRQGLSAVAASGTARAGAAS